VLVRVCAVLFLCFGLVAGSASARRGNGDPASHVLLVEDTFLPVAAPPPSGTAELRKAVADVYARSFRIKVAVVGSPRDLGTVPMLFNKPGRYANLLGREIASAFIGALLIVMPSGFGVYDGGRSTAAESRVLKKLRVSGPSSAQLVRSAAATVRRLLAANALRSKDILAPSAIPRFASVRRGTTATLMYSVLEDSHRSKETIRVLAGTTQLARFTTRFRVSRYADVHTVKWEVPSTVTDADNLQFCVVATDPAGNTGRAQCAPIQLVT
jgi:hypothetical protein